MRLVHISEMAHRYITDPNEAVKLGDKVNVKVLEVDIARKRIAVSIKQAQEMANPPKATGSKIQESAPKKPASHAAKKDKHAQHERCFKCSEEKVWKIKLILTNACFFQ